MENVPCRTLRRGKTLKNVEKEKCSLYNLVMARKPKNVENEKWTV
jgi:hypothetical protein